MRDLEDLISRVLLRYHDHLRRTLPALRRLAADVASSDGYDQPQLIAVAVLVDKLADRLIAHIDDEERRLFPDLILDPIPPRVGATLASIQEAHEEVIERFAELREVAGDYVAPDGASAACKTLMLELATLEAFHRRHDRLEDDLLAPKILRAQAVR